MLRRSQNKVENVTQKLEIKLLDGSYPKDSRLPSEEKLAKEYSVSRNTIREAIQRLIARGLLRSKPGAGVIVVKQTRKIISPWYGLFTDNPFTNKDMLEFRRVLEGATAYFAAQRASDVDIKQIHNWLIKLEESHQTDDIKIAAEADEKFHEAIAKASNNTMFLHLQSDISSIVREHINNSGMYLRKKDHNVSNQLLLQHQAIYNAISEKKPEEARTAMHTHIDYVSIQIKDM